MDEIAKAVKFEQKKKLSLEQENAIDLLILGQRDRSVAQAVGVQRATVALWRNRHGTFQAELNRRRKETWQGVVEQIQGLAGQAVSVIADKLQRGSLRAAIEILKMLNITGFIQSAREAAEEEEFFDLMEREVESLKSALVSYRERKEAEGSSAELTQDGHRPSE